MVVAAPGDRWRAGGVDLAVVWPTRLIRGEGSDPNNASVTLLAELRGVRALLGGDLEPAAQDAVLTGGLVPDIDVVKVPHHGSAKQAPGWVTAARPELALIGVGLLEDGYRLVSCALFLERYEYDVLLSHGSTPF